MFRLDLSYFYRLSLTFERLRALEPTDDIMDIWLDLHGAQGMIEGIFSPGPMRGCYRSSYASALALHKALVEQTGRDWGEPFTAHHKAHIVTLLTTFETILQSELAVAEAYYIDEKRGYSTAKLITEGEILFPADLPSKVPEAIEDLREAGKCLAFELATASGFHTLRATEAVLRRYWETVTGHLPKPKQRNLGVYLKAMKDLGCGDPKVIAALQQLKDLHRNVIFHPEESLTVDQAVSLLGIAHSVVDAMLRELPTVEIVEEPEEETMAAITAPDTEGEPPRTLGDMLAELATSTGKQEA